MSAITDRFSRRIHDLRVSVTDRCNFRCTYCMPKETFGSEYKFLQRSEILSFEEIVRCVRLFASLGVRKVRLTGGEPLLRKNLEVLVERVAAVAGVEDVGLTTNGSILDAARARELAAAGLSRVTVSLDALDQKIFSALSGADFPVARVLAAIDHAAAAGLPVKINMVVKSGVNDGQVLPMARHFHGSGHVLRFIEYMDVGTVNGWHLGEVLPAAEIIGMISAETPVEPVSPGYRGEVAQRWRYRDGGGEIGVVASVTQPFCRDCSRLRLSAEGKLYTCLFAVHGHDLRRALRRGDSDEALTEWLGDVWRRRADRYSELRSDDTAGLKKIEMSYIGG